MFFRLVRQSLARSPRRKLLTVVAVALASSIATAMLAVLVDIGDRHTCPLGGKHQRGRATDAIACASHHRDPVVQFS